MSFKLIHLFVPHESNNHRAILLKPFSLVVLIGIYLLNQLLIKSLTIIQPGVLGYSSKITTQQVYNLTNDRRVHDNLAPLHYNSQLEQSAISKAKDMFEHNYWAHNSPSGTTPWDFFKGQNYYYLVAGENLAKDFFDTDSLMTAWMNSPTHKANIVSDKYQEIGIGVVEGVLNGVKTTLVVQHFGTPQDLALIEVNNPIEIQYLNGRQVLSSNHQESLVSSQGYVSPLTLTKIVGLILFLIIIAVLIVDSYITLKSGTHRLTGSTASHLGFIFIILFFLLFTRQGMAF